MLHDYYTRKEAIKLLNVRPGTFVGWVKNKPIRYIEIKSNYTYSPRMYLKQDVDALIGTKKPRGTAKEFNGVEGKYYSPPGKGTINTPQGYVVRYSPDHPHANSSFHVFEHRLVMEKHLGRYLEPKETVHHIDGNRANNDISNLVLYGTRGEHLKAGHSLELRVRSLASIPKYKQMVEEILTELETLRANDIQQPPTPETLEDCINYIASTA